MADGMEAPELVKLNKASLQALPAGIERPRYDRSQLSPGIVHIGLGNFHRAHQAWYLHSLMQTGKAYDWAIIGAGVRPPDAAQRERLKAQDCLSTLIKLDPLGKSAEVIGSMIDFIPVEDTNASLIALMAAPEIRIVSLTVTESGYFIAPASGCFDSAHPDIQHDASYPATPRTAFGAIIAALKIRRAKGFTPFTCQSCDNLQGNGTVLRQTVVSLARLTDPDLADWIDRTCSFPNSMVDCIAPATGPKERELVKSFGILDTAPVTHEAFRQWVIEDDFPAGRPPWEEAGASISDDVHIYETMKIRLLNGGHQVIAAAGDLLGYETIAGALSDPLIRDMLEKISREEIAPHVAPTPDMSPQSYATLIARRFANPEIADTTRRVAYDGSSRHPGFILPSVRDGIAASTPVSGLVLVAAIWCRYCEGVREDGAPIEANDPLWDDLHPVALASRTDPAAWLGLKWLFGDLGEDPVYRTLFSQWRQRITEGGTRAAIRAYLEG